MDNQEFVTRAEVEEMITDMKASIEDKLDNRFAKMMDSIDAGRHEQKITNARLEMLREKTAWGEVGGPSTIDIIMLSVVVATGIITVAVQFTW